jgi:hypothetical protein
MGVPIAEHGQAVRRWVLVAACLAVVAGCVPASEPAPSTFPTPPAEAVDAAEQARELLDYTIDLPAGWNDLTEDYLGGSSDSVLAGFWSMSDDADDTELPFATMSLNVADPEADPNAASEEAAERWAEGMDEPERGDSGYAETADGGVIRWASVTGTYADARRTIHAAHVYYGPYYMYVAIDVPAGDEESAHALLDALATVTMSGPIPTGDRAGAPVLEAGRWTSYCGYISSDAQPGWEYQFAPTMDSTLWRCPEPTDYLGEWSVQRGGTEYVVRVERARDSTIDERLDYLSTPSAVGETGTTPNGFDIEVLALESFAAPNGSTGIRLDTGTTPPGEQVAYVARLYAYEDEHGGVVQVFVYDRAKNVIPETDWLEPFIASLATS